MLKDAILTRIRGWTPVAPLLASVFAPFSILFDIPALTEPWFIRYDPNVLLNPNAANSIPDRPASLALSAIGLAFNVFANALLIVRFSTTASLRWWRIATFLSLIFWIAKVTLALVNLVVFGRLGPGERRGEGLWCAVVSLIIAGLITFLLVCHWFFEFNKRKRKAPISDDQLAVRIAGRHFMLNVTFFVFDLGLLALIASEVEDWTYFQGIYFVTETYLTIGFGDFYATHTVTRVLLFFFAVVGIAQLGNIVGMLVEFFSSRSSERRAASKEEHERRRQQEGNQPATEPDLEKEIEYLHHLGKKQETRTRWIQLGYSLGGLAVFWAVGAVLFSHLEGWAYGTSLYFAYVTFLTIGYGDYTPITPAGRVVFVLYAIVGVPIMASFAVQAVQQVFAAFSARQYDKTRARRGLDPDIEYHHRQGPNQSKVVSHADFVENWHRDWEARVRQQEANGFNERQARELADRDQEKEDRTMFSADGEGTARRQEQVFDQDARLTEQVLERALLLELRARKLLISILDASGNKGGPLRTAKLLLQADRNMQLRDIKVLLKEIGEEQRARGGKNELEEDAPPPPLVLEGRSATITEHVLRDEPEVMEFPAEADEHETFQEIQRYREDFAGLLAAGSRLMRLKGSERALFERRRILHEQDDSLLE